jgi:hypothetical protein
MKKKWAFIYKSPGCDPEIHQSIIESPKHLTLIYGVKTIEEGCALAQKIVDDGCKLIELCGGFGAEGARKVIAAVEGRVPVGFIDYFPEEFEKLRKQNN